MPLPAQPSVWVEKIRLYRPLVVITGISLLGAAALAIGAHIHFMNASMGLFLAFLSALKLFDLQGFAKGFAGYDLLAARVPLYAKAYPFIELSFAVLFLSGLFSFVTNVATIIVMLVGSLGVIQTLRTGQKVSCACVGTGFNLPVGRVTLAENMAMAAMSAMNIAIV